MNRLTFPLLILLSFIYISGNAQVVLSEKIQDSKLTSPNDKSLFLVDFWATWCAPCITAGEYLGVLQEQFSDDLYILSLSKENPETVAKFIEKRPSKLAVSIDFNGNNFDNHNVNSLPWAILFDADGDILWKGNPANLKAWTVQKLLRQKRKKRDVSEIFTYQSYEYEEEREKKISGDFELKKLEQEASEYPTFKRWNEYIYLQGSIAHILGYLLKANDSQINTTAIDSLSMQYELSFNTKTQHTTKELCDQILRDLHLSIVEETRSGEMLKIELPENKAEYWDTAQFEWGESNPIFLIDDSQLKADNISDDDMLYQLANLQKLPYTITRPTESRGYSAHDWLVHHKFYNLMQSNLSNYGIHIAKESGTYPYYRIEKEKAIKRSFFKILSLFKRKK